MSEPTATADPKRKRFLWGIAVGWCTLIPLVYGCSNSFKGISEQKATGVGAVAGGVAEACVIVGALVLILYPRIAIYLLVTSWSRGQATRNFLSVITILWSGFTLLLIFGAAWMIFLFPHQQPLR
ncbi:MAG TPA: hypothetical protein VMT53_22495 [Terriglobales bacterium]|nr:hypothetical protein [Terriglobales bacterium]